MPFPSEYTKTCGECIRKPPPFSAVINFGIYEGALAEAINQMKFHGARRLSKPLGMLIYNSGIPQADGIVPVPLTLRKLRERGFNQSLLISRVISKGSGIPLLMDILFKTRETPPQTRLSAKERRGNLKGAFEGKVGAKGLRLLLVDDVMTTGATVTECSRQLIKAGAREIIAITLARSVMG
jgi:ComF family protein